ncbi:beta-glucanase [Colwellia sp. 12G3]|nr:beta-glucanase [Colwellia sp. 12G3]
MFKKISLYRLFSIVSFVMLITLSVNKAQALEEVDDFQPAKLWKDDNGVHINAHGGGVLNHEGKYYWFGEHKVAGKTGNKAHVGVHVYISENLTNWKDAGIALKVSDDAKSEITKGAIIERPKVLFNETTGKFVMWFHLELKGQGYKAARTGVAVADKPTGPYRFIKSVRPNAKHLPINITAQEKQAFELMQQEKEVPEKLKNNIKGYKSLTFLSRDFTGGQMARDMTLFKDKDGKAYQLYSSEENQTLHISLLNDDYLSHSGRFIRMYSGGQDEAPAIAYRAGQYHLLTSGLSGWKPNAAKQYIAKHILGPWNKLNNPTLGINPENGFGANKTFGGQSTHLLALQNKPGHFIAMFDLWRPDNAIDGRYIWLPVEFVDGVMRITWQDNWDLSIFE